MEKTQKINLLQNFVKIGIGLIWLINNRLWFALTDMSYILNIWIKK